MDIYKKLEDSLYDAIDQILKLLGKDCEIKFSNEKAVEPKKTYCVIDILSATGIGFAQTDGLLEVQPGGLKQYNVRQYEVNVQLKFIGRNAAEFSMDFWSQYRGNSRIKECYVRNKLAPRRISNIRRSPELRESAWVNGFTFDMTLGWAVQTEQEMDWADYITVNGNTIPLGG